LAYLIAVTSRSAGWAPSGGEEWIAVLGSVAAAVLLLVWLTNIDIPLRLLAERRRETNQLARSTPPTGAADLDIDIAD
jgi:hypothetical protein